MGDDFWAPGFGALRRVSRQVGWPLAWPGPAARPSALAASLSCPDVVVVEWNERQLLLPPYLLTAHPSHVLEQKQKWLSKLVFSFCRGSFRFVSTRQCRGQNFERSFELWLSRKNLDFGIVAYFVVI
jgi:hypothetical protein